MTDPELSVSLGTGMIGLSTCKVDSMDASEVSVDRSTMTSPFRNGSFASTTVARTLLASIRSLGDESRRLQIISLRIDDQDPRQKLSVCLADSGMDLDIAEYIRKAFIRIATAGPLSNVFNDNVGPDEQTRRVRCHL